MKLPWEYTMGIPWVKKFWSFCTLGRHGWRKNFPAAEGGRQIFWVVPWEFDPQMIFFACPCMIPDAIGAIKGILFYILHEETTI